MFYPNRKLQLLDIAGVKAGGQAIINCPKGPRYKAIVLEYQDTGAGNTAGPGVAFNTETIVVVGSNIIRRFTGSQLDLINKSNGAQFGAISVAGAANGGGVTRQCIYFEEPWRKRADYQNGLALETGWMASKDVFQIRVSIVAGVTASLTAYAIVDDYSSGKANDIVKLDSQDVNTNGATVQVANPFAGAPNRDLISQISFFDPSDSAAQSKTVIKARLTINNVVVHDDITLDQSNALHSFSDMAQNPAGIYNLTFDHDDLFESLRMVGNISSAQLMLTLKAASAGTMTRITQRLGSPL